VKKRTWLAAAGAALFAALALPLHAAAATQQSGSAAQPVKHVVVVGLSGLTWDTLTQSTAPELWRLAEGGSVGALVDYAQQPVACPADGWLTLNSAARAQGSRPCTALPQVTTDGPAADTGAEIPSLPQIIAGNQQFHEAPDWGLLASVAACSTAVGPGAALALAAPNGHVASYVPSAGELSASVLARCPLTVVDLGQIDDPSGARDPAQDQQLAALVADLPPSTLLLVTAPGAAVDAKAGVPVGAPHLMSVMVSGPGFAGGLLSSSATRRPGIVALTDLTPTIAAWLGRPAPPGTVGAVLAKTNRGALAATVDGLRARDSAEQVWIATHGRFYLAYAALGALAFGVPALLYWGATQDKRRRRAQWWRVAGVAMTAVPLASFLADAAPWWTWAHPAWWLYGLTTGWTLLIAVAALSGPWRRSALGPFGVISTATLLVLAIDVMLGSRLQLDAPFGLSLLVSGRYFGIGNEALGVYSVSTLVTAAWLAALVPMEDPQPVIPRGPTLVVGLVGVFAVVASGWPGFGAKVGGSVALVPCLILLAAWFAGFRVGRRLAVPVLLSGVVVFLAFAVLSYFLPAAGVSDMGTFAGNLLHGRGGTVLQRKVGANVGSLTLNIAGWLVPVAAVAAAAALRWPAALRLRTLDAAFAALPLVRALAWLCWLVLVLGWFADDSGVLVPAVALPFVVPLTVAMTASVSVSEDRAGYFGTAFAGSSVGGRPPK
jgi:hypothetical protein